MSSTIYEIARSFFDACETGKGWEACKEYCHPNASFSAQADALADITSLEAYVEWAKGLLTPIADGRYELKFFGVDETRNVVCAFAVFHGTHTGEGGPIPPTGKNTSSDYVYSMTFEDGLIRHMTKIWNDGWALRDLGWA